MFNKKAYIIICLVSFFILFYIFVQKPVSDVYLPEMTNTTMRYYDAVDNNVIENLMSITRLGLENKMRDDHQNAFIRTFYENGKVHIDAQINNNNKINGYARIYFENGYMMLDADFMEGHLHGSASLYNEDGHILRDYSFFNGQLFGISREYHDNGHIWKDKMFVEGKLTGSVNIYHYDSGRVLQISNYKDNLKDGETVGFDENSTVIYRELFEHGVRVMRLLYDHRGNVIK